MQTSKRSRTSCRGANIRKVGLLSTELKKKNESIVEAVAFQEVGVFETLKETAKQVLTGRKSGG
jgi:hypothetical protein